MKKTVRDYLGKEGFTLLELMVVVCILGVLSVIAIPKFSTAMAQANSARIQMDLRTLDTAINMYKLQYGKAPTDIQNNLKEFVEDVDKVKPPQGECILSNGDKVEIKETSYTLATDGKEALCGTHGIQDFGQSAKPQGQGTAD